MRRQRGRIGLMMAVLCGLMASQVSAEVSTEKTGTLLVFPKVIANGTRDTVIQIASTSQGTQLVHCFYVNGSLTFPDQEPSEQNPPLCTVVDFTLQLTRQQPTHWVVSAGRVVDATDSVCSLNPENYQCDGAGLDPGRIPPVVEDFVGELKCVEVDASGYPNPGNHLYGEATIIDGSTADASKYNALSFRMNNNAPEASKTLCLGGTQPDEDRGCPIEGVFDGCPANWVLNHLADGAEDPVVGGGSSVTTNITVVPCTEYLESQDPSPVTIQFAIFNEFEQQFSASTTVGCWADLQLEDINPVFNRSGLFSDFVETRMRGASNTNDAGHGFLVVAETTHSDGSEESKAAANLHLEGERAGIPDVIELPQAGESIPGFEQ